MNVYCGLSLLSERLTTGGTDLVIGTTWTEVQTLACPGMIARLLEVHRSCPDRMIGCACGQTQVSRPGSDLNILKIKLEMFTDCTLAYHMPRYTAIVNEVNVELLDAA